MKVDGDTFATAFNCMDGRCQRAVSAYMRATYGVDWVDAINEPGIDGILAGKNLMPEQPATILKWIRRKAEVSSKGHGSKYAVIVGHALCAGNNVTDSAHAEDIARAIETVRSWNLFEEVIGLMAAPQGVSWGVRPLGDLIPQKEAVAA